MDFTYSLAAEESFWEEGFKGQQEAGRRRQLDGVGTELKPKCFL